MKCWFQGFSTGCSTQTHRCPRAGRTVALEEFWDPSRAFSEIGSPQPVHTLCPVDCSPKHQPVNYSRTCVIFNVSAASKQALWREEGAPAVPFRPVALGGGKPALSSRSSRRLLRCLGGGGRRLRPVGLGAAGDSSGSWPWPL